MRSDSYFWQDEQGRSPKAIAAPTRRQTTFSPSAWQRFGHHLMSFFAGNSEPQIRQRVYRDQILWDVYDPITQQQHRFTSEQEVRIWLEQRYSQP